jgi:hypothetical protein
MARRIEAVFCGKEAPENLSGPARVAAFRVGQFGNVFAAFFKKAISQT